MDPIAPASLEFDEREVLELAARVAQHLPARVAPRLWSLSAEQALELERVHRIGFWRGETEALRDTFHAEAQRMFALVRRDGRVEQLGSAWAATTRAVHSASWREQVRTLTSRGGAAYPPLARLAQQAWTRAARWRAVMRDSPQSIFELATELIARGVWLAGVSDDVLHLVRPIATDSPELLEAEAACEQAPRAVDERSECVARERELVVLCAPSNAADLSHGVADALAQAGFRVAWGVRNEAGPPIEHLVGAEITAACAVVFVEFECDVDFGPPLWLKHEAEFATFASTPQFGVGRPAAPCWRALESPALRVCVDAAQVVRELDRVSSCHTTRSRP